MLGQHPETQLKIVHRLEPRGSLTPFAQLDALYQYIFSQVQDFEVIALILAWTMFTSVPPPFLTVGSCARFLGRQIPDIYVALSPLQSVVDCKNSKKIKFHHASLPDFLFDKERSQEYYINRSAWSTRLSVMAHKFVMSNGYQSMSDLITYH